MQSFHSYQIFLLCFLFAVSTPCYAFAFPDTQRGAFAIHSPVDKMSTLTSSSPFGVSPGGAVSAAVKNVLTTPSPTSLKSPSDLYQAAVTTGTMKAKASVRKIAILGLIAGCHIGFGAYLALSVAGNCPAILAENPGLQKMLFGMFGLPSGLIMTLVTGAELFTGNTALVMAAKKEGKCTTRELLKSWSVSYVANLIGSIALAWLCYQSGTLGASPGAVSVATAKCSMTWPVAFLRGILGNWMVCMAIYIANGCADLPGKMTSVWFLISAFTAMGFDHSVANMFFIPLGIFRGANISWMQMFTKNLIPVSLGNIIGGALCAMGPYGASFGNWLGKEEE